MRALSASSRLKLVVVVVAGCVGVQLLYGVFTSVVSRKTKSLSSISAVVDRKQAPESTVAAPSATSGLIRTSNEDDTTRANIVGFYNMYIPVKAGGRISSTVESLVREQLRQVATSYILQRQPLTLNVIALGAKVNQAWLDRMCRSAAAKAARGSKRSTVTNSTTKSLYKLKCILLKHHKEGSEMITLTHLYDHCTLEQQQKQKHQQQFQPSQSATPSIVLYFHDKGSFNPDVSQDRLRRSLTAALTSQSCVQAMSRQHNSSTASAPNDDVCSICSLMHQPLPGFHVPGNMWMADCAYISQLLSPHDFANGPRQGAVDAWIQNERASLGLDNDATTAGPLFDMADWSMGRWRFAAEHWVNSHPSLQPCDVSVQSRHLEYWRQYDRDLDAEINNVIVPISQLSARRLRYNYSHDYVFYDYVRNANVWTNETLRQNDYFLLRGMILRWLVYYGHVPDFETSYVWTWFPDGDYWKQRLQSVMANNATIAAAALQLATTTRTNGNNVITPPSISLELAAAIVAAV